MKKLSFIIRVVFAIISALLFVLLFGFISLLLLNSSDSYVMYLIVIIISLFSIYLAYYIAKIVYKRGLLEILSSVYSSPSLDNIKQTDSTVVRELDVYAFVNNFNTGVNFFTDGYIRIWGDWEYKRFSENNIIKNVTHNPSENFISIEFENGNSLTVWNPQNIIESKTYLKILGADRVKWEWKSIENSNSYFILYSCINEKIEFETNYISNRIDTIVAEPAISMLKYFK